MNMESTRLENSTAKACLPRRRPGKSSTSKWNQTKNAARHPGHAAQAASSSPFIGTSEHLRLLFFPRSFGTSAQSARCEAIQISLGGGVLPASDLTGKATKVFKEIALGDV
jgi:hypothetical protein